MTREQWLKLILPAAVILLAYGLLINIPAQRRQTGLDERLEKAQAKAEDYRRDAHSNEHVLQDLRRDANRLKKEIETLQAQATNATRGTAYSQSIATFNQVFSQHSLIVTSERRLGRQDLQKLPESYRQAYSEALSQKQEPFLWSVSARGSYLHGVAALRELGTTAVPIVVQMNGRQADGTLSWEIILWQ